MTRRSRVLLRLDPEVVHNLVPTTPGSYLLYVVTTPVYAGRSDTDLRRRLLQHASAGRADYFEFIALESPAEAFVLECAFFHALRHGLWNARHPARLPGSDEPCSFCRTVVERSCRFGSVG